MKKTKSINEVFRLNTENTIVPSKLDSVLCIAVILLCTIYYHLYALLIYRTRFFFIVIRYIRSFVLYETITGIVSAIILMLILLLIIRVRNQPLITIGITSRNLLKSSIYGILLSIPIILPRIVYSAVSNNVIIDFNNIMYSFLYNLIFVALIEEVYFRGYFFTRLEHLIQSILIRVIVCSIVFSLMHIPFQLVTSHLPFGDFLVYNSNYLASLFIVGIYMAFVYSKTNNIIAPILAHTIYNVAFEVIMIN